MVLINYEPQAPAAAIPAQIFPYNPGRALPCVTGMDIFQRPLPLGVQLSGREAGCFQGKRRKVPAILTCSSSICLINIQVQNTVSSNRANSGYSQILALVNHLLIHHHSALPSIPSSIHHTPSHLMQ